MKLKRTVAFLLVAVMSIFTLFACGRETPEEIIKKADEALVGERYKLETKLSMTCSNPVIAQYIPSDIFDFDIYFDGDNFEIRMEMEEELVGVDMEISLSYVGDTVYMYSCVDGEISKGKATVTAEQGKELLDTMLQGTDSFTPSAFSDMKLEVAKDGKTVITCTGFDLQLLDEYMSEAMGALEGMEFDISNVKLIAELEKGKYDDIDVTMDYELNVGSERVEIGASLEMDFDYEEGKLVAAPADADTYENISFEDIFSE